METSPRFELQDPKERTITHRGPHEKARSRHPRIAVAWAVARCHCSFRSDHPTSRAFATTQTCAPTMVGYNSTSTSSYIAMNCGGTSFYAWTTGVPTGCTAVSPDAAKAWLSLVQSAVLSGKKVTVYYSVCSSSTWNYISEIDLSQ